MLDARAEHLNLICWKQDAIVDAQTKLPRNMEKAQTGIQETRV